MRTSCPLPSHLYRGLAFLAPPSSFPLFWAPRRKPCSSLAASFTERSIAASWIIVETNEPPQYGGWAVSMPEIDDRTDYMKFLVAGVGISVAFALAALMSQSLSGKGFKFSVNASFHALHGHFRLGEHKNEERSKPKVYHASKAKLDDKPETVSNAAKLDEKPVSALQVSKGCRVPIAPDPTQQEALFALKKLKIVENDVSPNELCTRREYARWLVKVNYLLERDPRHRLVMLMSATDQKIAAFDDVSVNDPDFMFIQALGEAGIVSSKLSPANSSYPDVHSSSDAPGRFDFKPESFVSRFDLVNWKVLLEYPSHFEMEEKMLKAKVGFMDLNAAILDSSPQLLKDLMAGDNSITRRTFGNTRRLQPRKPATLGQAAVALASGRMAEIIRAELSQLEAENLSRLAGMEEIKSELIHRGDILRFWEEKINKEKEHGLDVDKDLRAAMHDLEMEKIDLDESFADFMKEKAALHCQERLLTSLREEVGGMLEELARDRASNMAEKESLEKLHADLCQKQETNTKSKSILEAEKEAVRILRSWVEESARETQTCAKVLEDAVHRWKWNAGSRQDNSRLNGISENSN